MAGTQRHRIRKLDVQVRSRDAHLPAKLKNRVNFALKNLISSRLSSLFDQFAAEGQLIRIHNLRINLGKLKEDSTQEEIETTIVEQVRKKLMAALANGRPETAPDESSRSAKGKFDLLEFYLLHGGMPWWYAGPAADLEEILLQVLEEEPLRFKSWLVALQKNETIRHRLQEKNGPKGRQAVLSLIAGKDQEVAESVLLDFSQAHSRNPLLKMQGLDFGKWIWNVGLEYFLQNRQKSFNKQDFLAFILKALTNGKEEKAREIAVKLEKSALGSALLFELGEVLPPKPKNSGAKGSSRQDQNRPSLKAIPEQIEFLILNLLGLFGRFWAQEGPSKEVLRKILLKAAREILDLQNGPFSDTRLVLKNALRHLANLRGQPQAEFLRELATFASIAPPEAHFPPELTELLGQSTEKRGGMQFSQGDFWAERQAPPEPFFRDEIPEFQALREDLLAVQALYPFLPAGGDRLENAIKELETAFRRSGSLGKGKEERFFRFLSWNLARNFKQNLNEFLSGLGLAVRLSSSIVHLRSKLPVFLSKIGNWVETAREAEWMQILQENPGDPAVISAAFHWLVQQKDAVRLARKWLPWLAPLQAVFLQDFWTDLRKIYQYASGQSLSLSNEKYVIINLLKSVLNEVGKNWNQVELLHKGWGEILALLPGGREKTNPEIPPKLKLAPLWKLWQSQSENPVVNEPGRIWLSHLGAEKYSRLLEMVLGQQLTYLSNWAADLENIFEWARKVEKEKIPPAGWVLQTIFEGLKSQKIQAEKPQGWFSWLIFSYAPQIQEKPAVLKTRWLDWQARASSQVIFSVEWVKLGQENRKEKEGSTPQKSMPRTLEELKNLIEILQEKSELRSFYQIRFRNWAENQAFQSLVRELPASSRYSLFYALEPLRFSFLQTFLQDLAFVLPSLTAFPRLTATQLDHILQSAGLEFVMTQSPSRAVSPEFYLDLFAKIVQELGLQSLQVGEQLVHWLQDSAPQGTGQQVQKRLRPLFLQENQLAKPVAKTRTSARESPLAGFQLDLILDLKYLLSREPEIIGKMQPEIIQLVDRAAQKLSKEFRPEILGQRAWLRLWVETLARELGFAPANFGQFLASQSRRYRGNLRLGALINTLWTGERNSPQTRPAQDSEDDFEVFANVLQGYLENGVIPPGYPLALFREKLTSFLTTHTADLQRLFAQWKLTRQAAERILLHFRGRQLFALLQAVLGWGETFWKQLDLELEAVAQHLAEIPRFRLQVWEEIVNQVVILGEGGAENTHFLFRAVRRLMENSGLNFSRFQDLFQSEPKTESQAQGNLPLLFEMARREGWIRELPNRSVSSVFFPPPDFTADLIFVLQWVFFQEKKSISTKDLHRIQSSGKGKKGITDYQAWSRSILQKGAKLLGKSFPDLLRQIQPLVRDQAHFFRHFGTYPELTALILSELPEEEKPSTKVPEADRPKPPRPWDVAKRELNFTGEFQIPNAGMILVEPFIQRYFQVLNLLEQNIFVDEKARERAIFLLHYLATGHAKASEAELVLPKVLVGMDPSQVVSQDEISVSEREAEITQSLLKTAISYWKGIGNTTPDVFQESFLTRGGILRKTEKSWYLKVDPRPYDLLLRTLPWSFSPVTLPWVQGMMTVEWSHTF
ncbi:MAG: hypothetical protein H6581_15840 [Bacteroidia bacterium]|nr:hypothetical protein [Bacteroidia bacterium]